MSKINVLILRTAGTNCDKETAVAFELLGARVKSVHVNDAARKNFGICKYQIIAFPGGFTYGDDIAAGKILANELKMKLKDEIEEFLRRNGLMIGICNGFQVLVKMGVLPGNNDWSQEATLSCNDSGKFEARWVYLKKPENRSQKTDTRCIWTKGIEEVIYLPVAHGEGKFIPKDEDVLNRLKTNGQVVFQYCGPNAGEPLYPEDPNGSVEHIAGICDMTGRIFGLMPHPERYVFRTQHPHWTRDDSRLIPDGIRVFKNAIDFLKQA